MQNLFHADNPFTKFMYKLGCLILLNIYFIICCLPIITIGAAFTAAGKVSYKLREETDVRITALFFNTFIKNLLNSTLIWVVVAGIESACVFGINYFFKQSGTGAMIIVGVCILVGIAILLMTTYVFVLLGRYDNDLLSQCINALKVAVSHLLYTIGIWLIWIVPIGVFVLTWNVSRYIGWIWIMFGLALIKYCTAGIYHRIFNKLEGVKDGAELGDDDGIN